MFHEGQQIGQYTLIRKLGKGGFGEVWLAEKRSQFVTKRVAVKLPLDEQVSFEAIRQEATLWEQASGHANVLPIIDADIYDGQVVIVSEYADGGSLHDKLKTEGKLPPKQAVEMTIGILNGLEFLHNKRIIHRDIKPANILLQGTTPRLADFGISRAMRTTMASRSQNISGTFAYMSPEALDGKRSIQTDIWSVGVNLYQFLTGKLPFPQKETSVLFPAIIMRDFEPLPDSIPQSLKNVITKALAKLPENRYKTTDEMKVALRKVLSKDNAIILPESVIQKQVVSSTIPIATAKSPAKINSVITSYSPKIPEQFYLSRLEKIKNWLIHAAKYTATLFVGLVFLYFLLAIVFLLIAYIVNVAEANPVRLPNNPKILASATICFLALILCGLIIVALPSKFFLWSDEELSHTGHFSKKMGFVMAGLLLLILGLIIYISPA